MQNPNHIYKGLLALTDKGIIFEDDKRRFNDIHKYSDINSLQIKKSLLGSKIQIEIKDVDTLIFVNPTDKKDKLETVFREVEKRLNIQIG